MKDNKDNYHLFFINLLLTSLFMLEKDTNRFHSIYQGVNIYSDRPNYLYKKETIYDG